MLINSVSGIRGTIGGKQGEHLTPFDILAFVSGYGDFLIEKNHQGTVNVVVGRDARPTGDLICSLVIQTLRALGINVIDLGPVPTPTVAMAVVHHHADAGIVITASHNPVEYNGLKMLNQFGEFLSEEDAHEIARRSRNSKDITFAYYDNIGTLSSDTEAINRHVKAILDLDIVDVDSIRSKTYKVVIDPINSVGSKALPPLLDALNINYQFIHAESHGFFAHPPEPLEEHLHELKLAVIKHGADLGIAVDPDVDRLVLVNEKGEMFGEEYTQVACADVVLSNNLGTLVTNLSSSRVLDDLAKQYGVACKRSPVGEKHVVTKMKETNALFGGEGSGGVIYPELHYGRDALVGVALVLNLLAKRELTLSQIRDTYTSYEMIKGKIALRDVNPQEVIARLKHSYSDEDSDTSDGLKINFSNSWVHIRPSNTEPIMRIYAEAKTQREAEELVERLQREINSL